MCRVTAKSGYQTACRRPCGRRADRPVADGLRARARPREPVAIGAAIDRRWLGWVAGRLRTGAVIPYLREDTVTEERDGEQVMRTQMVRSELFVAPVSQSVRTRLEPGRALLFDLHFGHLSRRAGGRCAFRLPEDLGVQGVGREDLLLDEENCASAFPTRADCSRTRASASMELLLATGQGPRQQRQLGVLRPVGLGRRGGSREVEL